ncbi:hypothetical protein L1887_18884 [Cichorium endivia]|nr:hypothetical protein L1887_18884 [Cichorium endivia]
MGLEPQLLSDEHLNLGCSLVALLSWTLWLYYLLSFMHDDHMNFLTPMYMLPHVADMLLDIANGTNPSLSLLAAWLGAGSLASVDASLLGGSDHLGGDSNK